MNTATAFEQMANAIPYIDKLVNSKEMKAFVEEKSKGDVVGRDILMKMLPILYAKHPKETMGILGAMHGKTAEEVAEMDFTETAAMMDKDTLDSLFAFLPLRFVWGASCNPCVIQIPPAKRSRAGGASGARNAGGSKTLLYG